VVFVKGEGVVELSEILEAKEAMGREAASHPDYDRLIDFTAVS
jgi:hypothetical protein